MVEPSMPMHLEWLPVKDGVEMIDRLRRMPKVQYGLSIRIAQRGGAMPVEQSVQPPNHGPKNPRMADIHQWNAIHVKDIKKAVNQSSALGCRLLSFQPMSESRWTRIVATP